MISLLYSHNFLKSAAQLPTREQQRLAKLLQTLADNPYHPRLHAKHLSGELAGLLSFRITREWRVIFQFASPDTIQLLRVGHRKNIYR